MTTSSGRAMAGLFAVFAEFERDLIRERIRAGLQRAREKGKVLGRPPTVKSREDEIRKLYEQNLSKSEIARQLGADRRSIRLIIQSVEQKA